MRDDALRRDVRTLGELLGETLIEQEGADLFEAEERVRALAKSRRAGRRVRGRHPLAHEIERLGDATAVRVARAFTHYFQLVNLAEQHHRARRRREYLREGVVQAGSLSAQVAELS